MSAPGTLLSSEFSSVGCRDLIDVLGSHDRDGVGRVLRRNSSRDTGHDLGLEPQHVFVQDDSVVVLSGTRATVRAR